MAYFPLDMNMFLIICKYFEQLSFLIQESRFWLFANTIKVLFSHQNKRKSFFLSNETETLKYIIFKAKQNKGVSSPTPESPCWHSIIRDMKKPLAIYIS